MRTGLIDGRVLVTGATGGLGAELARTFAARGASLVLSGRRGDVLDALGAELDAETVVADLAQRDQVQRLADAAGDVDVLVANAALPASGWFTELSQEQVDTLLEVNLRAHLALTKSVLPGMLERRRGQLVFISSLAGKAASPGASIYNATKFGLRGFALGLRQDLRGSGVGVSVILPGFISDAGMYANSGVKLPPGTGTRKPSDVARATLTAIERDRAEITVAPAHLSLGASIAAVAPELAARGQRLLGGERISRRFAAAQREQRPPR